LYSDLKLLSAIKSFEASLLAETLLRDTSFGIIQHPQSSGISWEHDEILKVWKKRPKVVDSAEKLNLQVQLIKGVLSPLQERSFAVEGQLHARQLRGPGNATTMSEVWLEEYMFGCDRDQIAFYAAAGRMDLVMESPFPCSKFERAGIYRSRYSDAEFTFAMHCSMDLDRRYLDLKPKTIPSWAIS